MSQKQSVLTDRHGRIIKRPDKYCTTDSDDKRIKKKEI